MKSRETLIRLKKFQVDEKRRRVVQIESMIADHTAQRDFDIFGEKRVNVLQLNLALDDLSKATNTP